MRSDDVKHTPGPWNVETPMDECFSIVDNAEQVYDWKMVASVMWDDIDEREPGRPFITKQEAEANAKLIAAAPTMMDALKGMIGLCQLVRNRGDLPTEARQALTHNHRIIAAYQALSAAGIDGFQPSDFDNDAKAEG